MRSLSHFLLLPLWLISSTVIAQDKSVEASTSFNGDIGFGGNYSQIIAHSDTAHTQPMPYISADWGSFFGLVDTFGYKLIPVGYGTVNIVTRVLEDGFTPSKTFYGNLDTRKSSIPLGIGTMQVTPWGAVLINAYHDVNKSSGNLFDALLAEKFQIGKSVFYPQLGTEYRSKNYVNYFYGISSAEAAKTTIPLYQATAANNYFGALLVETEITGNWYINLNLRKTWLDNAVSTSPLVAKRSTNSGYISLSYRFE